MKPVIVKSILKAEEQERLSFNRRFRRVTGDLDLAEPWALYRDKIRVFVNGKAKNKQEFSTFYCFKERDYSELNKILNSINDKIIKHREDFRRGKKLDKVEEIMRGVIYEVNKNEDSECFKANHLYKECVRKYVKSIFEHYKDKPFNSNECAQMWLDAHRELTKSPEFVGFSNLIKGNYLTFNSAFQYIFDYGYFRRCEKTTADEYLRFIFNTYSLASNDDYPHYRNIDARVRNDGMWFPVKTEEISNSMDILMDWFVNNKECKKLNPIEKACIMHCELVRMQAFPDGNHRLARLIANEILVESDFPCVSIDFDIRKQYDLATNKAIANHEIDDLIDIYYDQINKNAIKINQCLEDLNKKEENNTINTNNIYNANKKSLKEIEEEKELFK